MALSIKLHRSRWMARKDKSLWSMVWIRRWNTSLPHSLEITMATVNGVITIPRFLEQKSSLVRVIMISSIMMIMIMIMIMIIISSMMVDLWLSFFYKNSSKVVQFQCQSRKRGLVTTYMINVGDAIQYSSDKFYWTFEWIELQMILNGVAPSRNDE